MGISREIKSKESCIIDELCNGDMKDLKDLEKGSRNVYGYDNFARHSNAAVKGFMRK